MKKRIGIIGYGWIAWDVHYNNYKTVTDICEIAAVCDIKPEARQKAKDMLGKLYFLDSRLYSNRGSLGRWRSTYEVGGGTLYDWGIHMIDRVLCLVDSGPRVRFFTASECAFSSGRLRYGIRRF